MLDDDCFFEECQKLGFTLFTGTPCSYLRPFINRVIDNDSLQFIATPNEGDAVALASGAYLAGRKSVVMFQNSGLGNAVNPLTSLSHTFRIPFLGIVTLRGEPGGPKDEPQHGLMGEITTKLLELMKIPWAYFPTEKDEMIGALALVEQHMESNKTPFFFVMKEGSVKGYELKHRNEEIFQSFNSSSIVRKKIDKIKVTRTEALNTLQQLLSKDDVLIATTGKTGRELFELGDLENQFYMVGSMGCALPLAIGLTQSNFKGKVFVVDGDGALLMRMENMALTGQIRPPALVHILLDNGTHDSTGGQGTNSKMIDFCNIALACNYTSVLETNDIDELSRFIEANNKASGPIFVRLHTLPGSPSTLGRPTVTPEEVAIRFKKFITGKM